MSPAGFLTIKPDNHINKKINIISVSSTRAIHRAQNDVAKRVSSRIYRPSKVQSITRTDIFPNKKSEPTALASNKGLFQECRRNCQRGPPGPQGPPGHCSTHQICEAVSNCKGMIIDLHKTQNLNLKVRTTFYYIRIWCLVILTYFVHKSTDHKF